jgi:predicted Zn-ribbon and HTH transcriptional regulator
VLTSTAPKKGQSLIEKQVVGSKRKLLGNKKQRQLRRRRHAQLPQDIDKHVLNKLEEGGTAARVKLREKEAPKAISEAINMNKEKGKYSISHVVCTDHLSMLSKSKKRRGKRRCFKCNESGHLIASCPYEDNDEGIRRCFRCNHKDHMITSCLLMINVHPPG